MIIFVTRRLLRYNWGQEVLRADPRLDASSC
jgi:hypothetical protein